MKVNNIEFVLLELFRMNMIQAIGTEFIDTEIDVELDEIQEAMLGLYRKGLITFIAPDTPVDLDILSLEN